MPFAQWILIGCALALLYEGRATRRSWTAIDPALLFFTAVVVASCFTAWDPGYAFSTVRDYLTWVIIFALITFVVNDERRFIVFMLGYLLWNLKMSQNAVRIFASGGFRFRSWGATGAPGFFRNSGEMAIEMCVFLPISFYFYQALKPWLSKKMGWFFAALPATALIAILASSSRGGQMAGALVILLMALVSKHRVKAVAWLGVVAVVVSVLLPQEQRDRFSQMGEDENSISRLTYWTDGIEIMREHPALGIGYNNWLPYYHTHYNPDGELPHNIFVQAGSELGYTGLAGLIALILATFWVNHRTRSLAKTLKDDEGRFPRTMSLGFDIGLIGYMASGFFVTVLYYPELWINLAFTVALHMTTRRKLALARRLRWQAAQEGDRRLQQIAPAP